LPDFKSIKELNKYIEKKYIEEFIKKIGKEVYEILYHEVQTEWYQRNGVIWTPSDYERSMQLLQSVTCSPVFKNGSEYSVKIYYDTDKIQPMYGTDDKPWTRHMSVVDYSDVSEAIPYYIEYGNNSSIYEYQGVHPVKNVLEQLDEDKHLLTRFKELFELKGIKVE
jgi:hypothetical protein